MSAQPDPFEPTPLPTLLLTHPLKLLLLKAYTLLNALRSRPIPEDRPIRIVCISDTHNHIPSSIPPGDVLIHAGDLTNGGSIDEIQRAVDWLSALPHQEIVVISGNHDTYLDPRTRLALPEDKRSGSIDWKRVRYLQHRRLSLAINVDSHPSSNSEPALQAATERTRLLPDPSQSQSPKQRRITLYGAPQIPACGPSSQHAFQYPRHQDAWSETVPIDTDILITHTPPKYHMDLPLPDGMGCEWLLAEVQRVKPRLHVFGHVHWGAGNKVVWWDRCHDAFVKGMGAGEGWVTGVLSPRLWWSLVRVLYRGVRELIWDRVWGGVGPYTVMVNAAQMRGNTGKLGNAVQVVDI